jgi:hypothetical protein
MGLSYSNVTLKGPIQEAIAIYLEHQNASALISPTIQGITVIYELAQGCNALSAHLKCPVLLLDIHDDDILGYQLYLNGAAEDVYASCPGYFTDELLPPRGGDAGKLCQAFGAEDAIETVDAVLRHPHIGCARAASRVGSSARITAIAAGISDFMILEHRRYSSSMELIDHK